MYNKTVLLEYEGKIAYVTMNRPEVLNCINLDVLDELNEVIDDLTAKDDVSAVILKGAGSRAFVSGADIGYLSSLDVFGSKGYVEYGQRVFNRLEAMRKAVIAAIDGYALGGGCELALACDIRIATKKSRFALPEVGLGMIPGFAGTQRLPRLVGAGNAKMMVYTGKQITAGKAKEIGLVNEVVEDGAELTEYCRELAGSIAKNSLIAVSMAKTAINEGLSLDLLRGIEHEAAIFAVNFSSGDREEGIRAFLEKRKPNFNRGSPI
ncbi:enoyl-CoA hydratase/isomerase family protein [Papillibacter cinnamivorans]|uniref:short-chain-enoyl-CoA hydratase n=1 Tax=Papillibacter cinnamivorans DSM 12816 TaxID=1122930 RepID=A0A1W1ZL86_9FIRM|nr:enoyl-CoA hydratase-related protein [Papillibacter cinnamivorans]SMC49176.1 enoyl-CoA hydratase [Papillibacter cinnamivorans DSM 12816]